MHRYHKRCPLRPSLAQKIAIILLRICFFSYNLQLEFSEHNEK